MADAEVEDGSLVGRARTSADREMRMARVEVCIVGQDLVGGDQTPWWSTTRRTEKMVHDEI